MRWSPIGEYIGPSKESLLWEVVGSADVVAGIVVDVEAVVVVVGCSYFMALHSRPKVGVPFKTLENSSIIVIALIFPGLFLKHQQDKMIFFLKNLEHTLLLELWTHLPCGQNIHLILTSYHLI